MLVHLAAIRSSLILVVKCRSAVGNNMNNVAVYNQNSDVLTTEKLSISLNEIIVNNGEMLSFMCFDAAWYFAVWSAQAHMNIWDYVLLMLVINEDFNKTFKVFVNIFVIESMHDAVEEKSIAPFSFSLENKIGHLWRPALSQRPDKEKEKKIKTSIINSKSRSGEYSITRLCSPGKSIEGIYILWNSRTGHYKKCAQINTSVCPHYPAC